MNATTLKTLFSRGAWGLRVAACTWLRIGVRFSCADSMGVRSDITSYIGKHHPALVSRVRSRPTVSAGAAAPHSFNLFQTLAEAPLYAFVGGRVVFAVAKVVGQALHIGDLAFKVVGVLISLPIADVLHQRCRRVPQMKRHGLG